MSLITTVEGLPPDIAASISADEAAYIGRLKQRGALPFAVTEHFASLAGPSADDPIRRQFFPDPREDDADPFALDDPLGESLHRAGPRLVHQYRDRALLLAGGTCAGFCRHCFRSVWVGQAEAFIGDEGPASSTLAPILAYLAAHPEIREILVSGGDPLSASDERLAGLFEKLRLARPGVLLRVCTRFPITEPKRLAAGTIALFARYRPLRVVVHINHSRELSAEARQVLAACVENGIPVHVQTVLLRGINDNAETLANLFRECLDLGLTPYYLFQLDLARGTRHLRVPLKDGLDLYRTLKTLISGLGLPVYALDLPGGGRKIAVHEGVIAGEADTAKGKAYLLSGPDGKLWPYPVG